MWDPRRHPEFLSKKGRTSRRRNLKDLQRGISVLLPVREVVAQTTQQSGTQASSYSLFFPAVPEALDFSFRHPGALLKRHLGLWVLILFSSYLRRSRTALRAAVSPSPCSLRVRAHSPLEVPGPPGGAKPGFKEISAPASHSGTSGSTVPVLDEAQSDFPLGLGYPLRLVFVIPEITTQPLASDWAPSLQWGQSHSGPADKSSAYRQRKREQIFLLLGQ